MRILNIKKSIEELELLLKSTYAYMNNTAQKIKTKKERKK